MVKQILGLPQTLVTAWSCHKRFKAVQWCGIPRATPKALKKGSLKNRPTASRVIHQNGKTIQNTIERRLLCTAPIPRPRQTTREPQGLSPQKGCQRNYCPPEWEDSFEGTRTGSSGGRKTQHSEVLAATLCLCNPCAQPQKRLWTRTQTMIWTKANVQGNTQQGILCA